VETTAKSPPGRTKGSEYLSNRQTNDQGWKGGRAIEWMSVRQIKPTGIEGLMKEPNKVGISSPLSQELSHLPSKPESYRSRQKSPGKNRRGEEREYKHSFRVGSDHAAVLRSLRSFRIVRIETKTPRSLLWKTIP
jgi:hypothetical protein